jgi:hypothetical protein
MLMKLMAAWKEFVESLGTLGGTLILLTVILFAFFPFMLNKDSESWKAEMFVLGALVGIVNNRMTPPKASESEPTKEETETK